MPAIYVRGRPRNCPRNRGLYALPALLLARGAAQSSSASFTGDETNGDQQVGACRRSSSSSLLTGNTQEDDSDSQSSFTSSSGCSSSSSERRAEEDSSSSSSSSEEKDEGGGDEGKGGGIAVRKLPVSVDFLRSDDLLRRASCGPAFLLSETVSRRRYCSTWPSFITFTPWTVAAVPLPSIER